MAANNNAPTAFVLDDRSIAQRLDIFRAYSQLLPFDPLQPQGPNWAQVLLGYEAGALDSAKDFSADAWVTLRDRLASYYDQPELHDGNLPPEHAFLLTLSGLLETPQELLNQLPARHKALYYQQMLALQPQQAQADQLTLHFTLADGVREQTLPAGLEFDAGQDSAGTPLRYALTQPLSVNAARVTDLRWVVRDRCVPGGRRARVILDESAGVAWPSGGVRMFAASPAQAGQPLRADADRAVRRGRIIESSLLAIDGGVRSWAVTFASKPTGIAQAEISVDNAWVTLKFALTEAVLTLTLPADGGTPTAVTALDGLQSKAPLLRLTSDRDALLPEIKTLQVTVTGATDVLCTDDEGNTLTDGGLPFGQAAEVGCGVNLMSAAWWQLGDRLKNVTVTPAWSGLPATSFPAWYGADPAQNKENWLLLDKDLNVTLDAAAGKAADKVKEFTQGLASKVANTADFAAGKTPIKADLGYTNAPKNNADFTVLAGLIGPDRTEKELAKALPLFSGSAVPAGQSLAITLKGLNPAPVGSAVPDSDDPEKWPWYLRLTLGKDFMQQAYAAHQAASPLIVTFITKETTSYQEPELDSDKTPKLVAKTIDGQKVLLPVMKTTSVETSTSIPVLVPNALWNAPYLPQWSGIRVDYTAQEEAPSQQVITPFGYASQDETSPEVADVYLGIDGIEEGQLLTLYWQLKSPYPLLLDWQYLIPGEHWVRLPVNNEITDVSSNSVTGSAIWPGDASRMATSLPAGRMWIRGRALQLPSRDALRVALPTTPWLTGLVTNAATATLLNPQEIQADHFSPGLPAGRVAQALNAPETLQSVEQPWPAFGGQPAETRDAFEARVARRLRHRDRALNDHDIKTLLQEQNVGLRELVVLAPASNANGTLKKTIVVMPGLELSDSSDVRRPALSSMRLSTMAEGIKAIASPWLNIECTSPVYVPLSVGWTIAYAEGLSRTTVEARARSAMKQAFMPWCAAAGEDVGFPVIGRRITQSAVRDVLRNVPGVKSIAQVYLNGSDSVEPVIEPDQVAVVTCIPEEYIGLTLAWYASRESKALWGELTLTSHTSPGGIVYITWPKVVAGLGEKGISTANAEIYLVDLDSGQRLTEHTPLKSEVVNNEGSASPPQQGYADPRGSAESESALEHRMFAVTGNPGVFHLGVALVLKVTGQSEVTLSPDVVGQSITLNIEATGE